MGKDVKKEGSGQGVVSSCSSGCASPQLGPPWPGSNALFAFPRVLLVLLVPSAPLVPVAPL